MVPMFLVILLEISLMCSPNVRYWSVGILKNLELATGSTLFPSIFIAVFRSSLFLVGAGKVHVIFIA